MPLYTNGKGTKIHIRILHKFPFVHLINKTRQNLQTFFQKNKDNTRKLKMKMTRSLNFENGENTNQFNKAEKQTFQKKKQPKNIYIYKNKQKRKTPTFT